MHRYQGRKVAVVFVAAVALIVLSAGAAFAAPVLQPGQTSQPGMSGTCTNCHTYAKPAVVKPAALLPSHPYVAKSKQKLGRAFKIWGYVPPKLSGATNATLTIAVQRSNGHGKWLAVPSLAQTATLSATGKFKNKTNYAAKLTVKRAGRYRMRAKLLCKDAKGAELAKWSSFGNFKVVK